MLNLPLLETELETVTNPLLDENGQFVKPDEAVRNFATLWKEWDLWNGFLNALPKIILAVLIVVAGFILASLVSKIMCKAMKRQKVDFAVYNFIAKIVRFIIRLTFVLCALSMFIKLNSLIAALSAAGVAIGLGLQDSVSQFASGVQILLNHPFRTGDYVEVNGEGGFVSEIGFMTTIITTYDNKRVILPNSDITKNRIVNFSAEKTRRVDLTFSISYADDIARAKDVVMQTALENEMVLKKPLPEVYVGAHSASSIDLFCRVWCDTPNYWAVYFAMQENVKLNFDKAGVHIPFTQM
ncbi:MAG: mechanosensitive ion channel, partial [Clostridia bacterium]|nr:mechanosensitive ion channel [Clostridia bacterium]